jgi:D-alanyl-D-alanine carboxypeptidase (penicillin-binding protein 5/6)
VKAAHARLAAAVCLASALAAAPALAATTSLAGTPALAGTTTTTATTLTATTATSATAPATAQAGQPPKLGVTAAILIEQSTGQELYGTHADQSLPIASATKLMTALVTLEHARLDAVFTDPPYYPAAADSQIGLVPGERMSVRDLLLAMMLPSADDAAQDLAYNVGHGSVADFIAMMNTRARELGLAHTHYSTPIGLDTAGNYSSASDLVKLAAFLLHTQPFVRRAVALREVVLHTGSRVRVLANRNDLVGRVPWIKGVKTGHTLQAGYVLVGSGTRDGMTLISAVLGTSSQSARDANTLALLDYGFANFRLATPVIAGSVLGRPTVRYTSGQRVNVIAANEITRVVHRGVRLTTRVYLPKELGGPRRRGATVGSIVVLADGRPIARSRLVLAHALPAVTVLTRATRFVTRPFTLVLLAVILASVIGLTVRWRERARGASAADPEIA